MKAVILLSGGQDSTTALYWAKNRLRLSFDQDEEVELHALSCFYGQRHASELAAAAEIAALAGCKSHVTLDVSHLMLGGSSDLLRANEANRILPRGGMKDRAMPEGLPTSFVPGRNLLFLACAAARAGAVGASAIVTGVCQTDYSGYPDCRSEFVNAMNGAIGMAWPSMEPAPNVVTPLMNATKAQTVELAKALPGCMEALALSVTCYYGKRPGCGECPACFLRRKGFDEAGVPDPAEVQS